MLFSFKNRCKKVIFFSRDLKIGGMEKALVALLNQLTTFNVDVHLVLQEKAGTLLERLDPAIRVSQYSVCNWKPVFLRKIVNLLHRVLWGLAHYKKYDFSCNYATYMTMGSKLAAIASRNSSLYVHSDYFHYFGGNRQLCHAFFLEQGITELKNILFVSQEAMLPIADIFPELFGKFSVISNLIDYEDIDSNASLPVKETKPPKKLFLFLGRLEEESKRLTRLLETFHLVSQETTDFELWIIGDGPAKQQCHHLIQDYGLCKNVKMLGEKQNPYPYIQMADCVVVTSEFEGFPVIYNECLVLKTPIITTIPVSDDFIDFRKYSKVAEKDSMAIARLILNEDYRNIAFDSISFSEINRYRTQKLLNLF